MLLSYEIFLRIYDVLEFVFDVEDVEVGIIDLVFVFMELIVRKMNMNLKKIQQIVINWFLQEVDFEIEMEISIKVFFVIIIGSWVVIYY